MGEIADDLIARMWDDMDEDVFGSYGGYSFSRRAPSPPPEYHAVCSRCGKKLVLKLSGADYARFDRKGGKPHKCKFTAKLSEFPITDEAPAAKAASDDDEQWW